MTRHTILFEWPGDTVPNIDRKQTWCGGKLQAIGFEDVFWEHARLRAALERIADGWGITDLEGAREAAEAALRRPTEGQPS
jgi:hypothetical protein